MAGVLEEWGLASKRRSNGNCPNPFQPFARICSRFFLVAYTDSNGSNAGLMHNFLIVAPGMIIKQEAMLNRGFNN